MSDTSILIRCNQCKSECKISQFLRLRQDHVSINKYCHTCTDKALERINAGPLSAYKKKRLHGEIALVECDICHRKVLDFPLHEKTETHQRRAAKAQSRLPLPTQQMIDSLC